MERYKNAINVHHDLSPKRIQRDEEDVKAIIDVINENFISPFEEQELMSLSNGVLQTEKIANDLLTTEEKGLAALDAFIKDRLVKQATDFYETIKKLKLYTFRTLKKSVKLKIQDKFVQMTAEKNIFGRIAIMSQQRNIEMKEIFCYPLGPISWALADSMGTLKKTKKTILMHELEKNAEPSEEVLWHSCTIIDSMALTRKIETSGLTYEEFAIKLPNAVMSSGFSPQLERMLFLMCIAKFQLRMLNVPTGKVGILNSRRLRVLSANNKTELINFIVAEWKKNARLISNKLI